MIKPQDLTSKGLVESDDGVDEPDDGVLDLLIAVSGSLEVPDDVPGIAIEAVVGNQDCSGRKLILEPIKELVDAGLPVVDVVQGLAVLVQGAVLLKEIVKCTV